jgi:hypothetical protein
MMTDAEYRKYMDGLAAQVSRLLTDKGVSVDDAIGVCAGVCGVMLLQLPAEKREQVIIAICDFIGDIAFARQKPLNVNSRVTH